MANNNRRYYWLKLKEGFFDDKNIKFLRRLPDGDRLTIIYLRMQLYSLKTEGVINYSGILPSCEEELALALDEDIESVTSALNALVKLKLVEIWDNKTIYMTAMQDFIGSESSSAERVRRHREAKALQCNSDVTKCNTEIEIDIEKEIEIEKELKKENKNTPPLPKKINYEEYVSMTEEEYQKLIAEYGNEAVKKMIDILNNYKGSTGKKYKSDYRAILSWVVDKVKKTNPAIIQQASIPETEKSENPFAKYRRRQ